MKCQSHRNMTRVLVALVMTACWMATVPITANASGSPLIVAQPGDQSRPTVITNRVVFQSSPSADGDQDLLAVPLSGALPAETIASGAGNQQAASGSGGLVAYVDRTSPPSGDPADVVYTLKVRDLASGSTAWIRTGSKAIDGPSLSGGHLAWTEGAQESRDVMYCQLDGNSDGIADFRQTTPWYPAVTTLSGGDGAQYGACVSARGVAWTDAVGGSPGARVLFRSWNSPTTNVVLSAGSGYSRPEPHTAGSLVVWKQNPAASLVPSIAMHNLDARSTVFLGSVSGAANENPVTDGTRVAWQSRLGAGKSQVWLKDSNGSSAVAASASNQTSPLLLPDGVAWIDDRNDGGDLAMLSVTAVQPTTLALAGTSKIVGYGSSTSITGTLKTGATAVAGKPVVLKRGSTIVKTAVTGSNGAFSFSFTPASTASTYYVVFGGGEGFGASWDSMLVKPKARLSTPRVPSYVKRYRVFRTYTYLQPKHATGSTGATFYFSKYQKKSNGRYGYVLRKKVSAKAVNSTAYPTKSKATLRVKLPSGKWRVRVKHEDAGHYRTYSSYKYFRVYR